MSEKLPADLSHLSEDMELLVIGMGALKATIDNAPLEFLRSIPTPELIEVLVEIEKIRLAVKHSMNSGNITRGTVLYTMNYARDELVQLLENGRFTRISYAINSLGSSKRVYDFLLKNGLARDARAFDLVTLMVHRLNYSLGIESEKEKDIDLTNLRQLIPPQRIAPVQFEIRAGRLAIAQSENLLNPEDKKSVEVARDELISKSKKIVAELKRSNCDPRLIEAVESVSAQMTSDMNIVRIGISNIGCEMMTAAYSHELPDAVSAMLRAHTRGIEMFAAQFPEWRRFVENSASVQLSENDVLQIKEVTSSLVRHLKANPETVDPEVPATLASLNALISAPNHSLKRVAFAVLRSVENLISKVFSYGVAFLDQTLKKTVEHGASVASKAIIVSLLTLALQGATGMTSVVSKVQEMAWMKNAAELVQKQIEKMIKE